MILLGGAAAEELAGCATTVGPRVLTNSQTDYNNAVQKVVSEEVLLNIVRRRYYEAPQFVAVANITTQITNSVGVGVSGSGQFIRGGAGPNSNVYGVGASGAYNFSDLPMISIKYRVLDRRSQSS